MTQSAKLESSLALFKEEEAEGDAVRWKRLLLLYKPYSFITTLPFKTHYSLRCCLLVGCLLDEKATAQRIVGNVPRHLVLHI